MTGGITIGVVGKYTDLPDAYMSIIEAVHHAGVSNGVYAHVRLIDGETLNEQNLQEALGDLDGILVPGGFGARAFEGKILACKYARVNKIPFLGICLGLQAAVCEISRNVCELEGATSTEFDENAQHQVIHIMPDQENIDDKGGTMRLGAYPCEIVAGTLAQKLYGAKSVMERHRHRYEVNNQYREILQLGGVTFCGLSPNGKLVEMIELADHPYFIASQAHPEFKSRPTRPHPLFDGLVAAAKSKHSQ